MIISDLQFYDIFWKRRFESRSLRRTNQIMNSQVPQIVGFVGLFRFFVTYTKSSCLIE